MWLRIYWTANNNLWQNFINFFKVQNTPMLENTFLTNYSFSSEAKLRRKYILQQDLSHSPPHCVFNPCKSIAHPQRAPKHINRVPNIISFARLIPAQADEQDFKGFTICHGVFLEILMNLNKILVMHVI